MCSHLGSCIYLEYSFWSYTVTLAGILKSGIELHAFRFSRELCNWSLFGLKKSSS